MFDQAIQKRTDGLCEVVFDVSSAVQAHLGKLDEKTHDRLWDTIEGSRGLFWQYVLPWAREYQAYWLGLSDAQREATDYLAHVDDYASKKFWLLMGSMPPDVVSIQVVPVIETAAGSEDAEITFQPEGPTDDTSYWSVYQRDSSGLAHWVADLKDENKAMMFGEALADRLNVKIEPQPWKEVKPVAPAPQQSFRVVWEIDVIGNDTRHAAKVARQMQLAPDSTANVFDVFNAAGGVARVDLGAPA